MKGTDDQQRSSVLRVRTNASDGCTPRAKLPREGSTRAFLLYFFFIGTGFILIEVALIQKFVLFLGQPVYALTCVIFTLLLSSGLGSFFSRKLIAGELMQTLLVGGLLCWWPSPAAEPIHSVGCRTVIIRRIAIL